VTDSPRSGTRPIPLARPPEFVVCPLCVKSERFVTSGRVRWPASGHGRHRNRAAIAAIQPRATWLTSTLHGDSRHNFVRRFEQKHFSVQSNHPVILPISGAKLRSITAGTALRVPLPVALQREARLGNRVVLLGPPIAGVRSDQGAVQHTAIERSNAVLDVATTVTSTMADEAQPNPGSRVP
jgi:hypothetical protein